MCDSETLPRFESRASDPTAPAENSVESQLRAARTEIATLRVAVEHRTTIGEAVGIVMERFHIDAPSAFEALRRVSSHTNRKIFDIAVELVNTGRTDGLEGEG